MGFMKQIKDMKTMAAAAPGMFDQAQQLKDNAAQLQAANATATAAGAVPGAGLMPGTVDASTTAPINGISLEEYARIAKTIGEQRLDQAGTEALVQRIGHSVADWQGAYDGWNDRFKGNTALSVQFGTIYQSAQAY